MISGVLTTDLRADILIERAVVALTTPMDIEVTEIAPEVASLIVPIVVEEEEVQVTKPMVSIVPRGPVVAEIAEEKEPIMVDL